jgi:hypothetical protein
MKSSFSGQSTHRIAVREEHCDDSPARESDCGSPAGNGELLRQTGARRFFRFSIAEYGM